MRTVADVVGDRIKQHRQALGMTQRQLAALVGVSVSTVVRWERSRRVPIARLTRIAEALSVTVASLIGGDE